MVRNDDEVRTQYYTAGEPERTGTEPRVEASRYQPKN